MQATTHRGALVILPPGAAPPAIRGDDLHAIETDLARSLGDWVGTPYLGTRFDPVAGLRRRHQQRLPVTFVDSCMAGVMPARA